MENPLRMRSQRSGGTAVRSIVGMARRLSLTSLAEGLGRAWIGGGLAIAAATGREGTADPGSAITVAGGTEVRSTAGLRAADTSDCTGVRAQPEPIAVKMMTAKKRFTGTTPPTPLDSP